MQHLLKVVEVDEKGVHGVDQSGRATQIQGQKIVVATGFARNDEFLQELFSIGIEAYQVGDCLEPRKIYEAIHEGSRVSRNL